VSVERETFPGLLESGARVSGHVDAAYWRDLGTPLDLVKGSADLVRGVAPSAALPGPTGEWLLLDGAQVDDTARVFGGTIVGRGGRAGVAAGLPARRRRRAGPAASGPRRRDVPRRRLGDLADRHHTGRPGDPAAAPASRRHRGRAGVGAGQRVDPRRDPGSAR